MSPPTGTGNFNLRASRSMHRVTRFVGELRLGLERFVGLARVGDMKANAEAAPELGCVPRSAVR